MSQNRNPPFLCAQHIKPDLYLSVEDHRLYLLLSKTTSNCVSHKPASTRYGSIWTNMATLFKIELLGEITVEKHGPTYYRKGAGKRNNNL
jgi:hypothetical protein